MIVYLLVIVIGYLLGSISPAYILGRFLKKVDIRKIWEKNAGTTNVFHCLGFWPAVITATYDVIKGLLAIYIGFWLGVPEVVAYSAGLAAIIGHIFPFYLGFRGGHGAATSVGLLLYFLYLLFKDQFLPLESMGILAIVVLALYLITRQKKFLILVVAPALSFMIFRHYQINLAAIFAEIIIIYLFALNIYLSWRDKLFVLKKETITKILPWRTVLRPFAIVFPLAYFYFDKNIILWVVGVLAGICIIVDLIRLLHKKTGIYFSTKATRVYKKGEEKRFSSISLFLFSSFVVVLIFPKMIAITALVFLIFGDIFAKFFGSEYGKTKIFGEKTLEGSIAHLVACFLAGYILWPYVGLSPVIIITGAIIATITEVLPWDINDNLSVPLISASVMYILQVFF